MCLSPLIGGWSSNIQRHLCPGNNQRPYIVPPGLHYGTFGKTSKKRSIMKQDRYLDRDFLTNWKISKVPEILGPSGAIHLFGGLMGQLFGSSVTYIIMVWSINHSDPHQYHQGWWPPSPWPCPPFWCWWPPWCHPPHRCYQSPIACCCPPLWCWSKEECSQLYASSQRG